MAKAKNKPDVADLPAPQMWGTYCAARENNWERPAFKIHDSIGNAKRNVDSYCEDQYGQAVSVGYYNYQRPMASDVYVYEYVNGVWEERYTIRKGTYRKDHPLWQRGSTKGLKAAPATDDEVAKAIASILGGS